MWIKSQSKQTLIDTNNIYIGENECEIFTLLGTVGIKLGVYNSPDIAMEVLNNIQDFILNNSKTTINNEGIFWYTKIIYDMPDKNYQIKENE